VFVHHTTHAMAFLVATLLVSLLVAEASTRNEAMFNRIMSKTEIASQMTIDKALTRFQQMDHGGKGRHIVAFVQERMQDTTSNLRNVVVHHSKRSTPTKLDGATAMLNQMMVEANMKKELEMVKCQEFENKQEGLMKEARDDIAAFNAEAAGSRSEVLRAQGQIHVYEEKIPQTQTQLDEHNARCAEEVPQLKNQLAIVLGDLKVMEAILKLTTCKTDSDFLFLQLESHQTSLLECECRGGKPIFAMRDSELGRMMSMLRSNLARQYMHNGFMGMMRGSRPRTMFLQEDEARNLTVFQPNTLNVSDVPRAPVKEDCVITNKCNLATNPECGKLRDRFLVIQAGIEEKKDELSEKLVELEHFCEETRWSFESQIEMMQANLRDEETSLASSTKQQVTAESQSHRTGKQFQKLEKEYHEERHTCCVNQNNFLSEVCALEKIRGELYKMEGQKFYITDCEVSPWTPAECTKSCGGGTQILTRNVVVHPNGGSACPPLKMERSCNDQKCPVNCEMADWGEWSGCSAECGGGVIERTRGVKVEMENGGKPCEPGSQSETCNIQACDRDCELAPWSDWEPCSKMCGGGTQRHFREVIAAKVGDGHCDAPDSEERLGFKDCNMFDCAYLVPKGRTVLNCQSNIDVIVLLDGSGSLRQEGWDQSVKMATALFKAFESDPNATMALQLFSGPTTWSNYEKCTSSDPNVQVDLSKDCGITWVKHFTADIKSISAEIPNLKWPRATTLTASALAEAASELTYSRSDANSVVIVITDGVPMSKARTAKMAEQLQQKARLMWVPVGRGAPKDDMREWASSPKRDNLVIVEDFADMTNTFTLNTVISSLCPKVG